MRTHSTGHTGRRLAHITHTCAPCMPSYTRTRGTQTAAAGRQARHEPCGLSSSDDLLNWVYGNLFEKGPRLMAILACVFHLHREVFTL